MAPLASSTPSSWVRLHSSSTKTSTSHSHFPNFLLRFPSSSSSSHSCSSFDSCSFSVVNGLWRNQVLKAHAMSTAIGNLESSPIIADGDCGPDHLLVLVHGIMGSPSDWTYFEAQLKKHLGRNFLIYASSTNTFTKTFGGIDVSGKRLAEEVKQVVEKTKCLKKISFLSHSLGGLFARYAAAVLYTSNCSFSGQLNDSETSSLTKHGLIAGLEPINFITLATPHLGVRGKKQLPLLFGLEFLEKLAPPIAPFLVGQTGSQLFLTDGNPDKPPLLLQMATDCEDWKFISALAAFECRILYSNAAFDHMVGWRTSSIRGENELPNLPQQSLDGYEHILKVDYCPPASSDGPHFDSEVSKAKVAAQTEPSVQNTAEYHELAEEEMIRGLQRLGWSKCDVSFHSAPWPFFAHNNINVKYEWLNGAGSSVVKHVAEALEQHEASSRCGVNI